MEEAGGGKGRARPWRMTTTGLSVTAREDPASRLAADALLRMIRQQQIAQVAGEHPHRLLLRQVP